MVRWWLPGWPRDFPDLLFELTTPDLPDIIQEVAQAFDQLGVAYEIGGSMASSVYGIARSSVDIDVVADVREPHVDRLVGLLRDRYYIEADEIREAIRLNGSFNVIHLPSMFKVDVFVLKPRPFDQEAMKRRRRLTVNPNETSQAAFMTPEDVVLNKLLWYQLGNQSSERQRQDVMGILKVQGRTLDLAYLKKWAQELGVGDLLDQFLREAGRPNV